MDRHDVAKRIKELREERKMTQNALAYQAGVSPTYIYQLERGEKNPTIEYIDNICWGLGITIEQFFSTKKEPSQETDRLAELTPDQKEPLNRFLNSL